MVKRTGPSNPGLKLLIRDLKRLSLKEKVNVWTATARNLEKSTRTRRSVNLVKIEKYAKEQETILVPGKVLGSGTLTKNIQVAAFAFSDSAKVKLGTKAMTLPMLMQKNPKGKNVRILG